MIAALRILLGLGRSDSLVRKNRHSLESTTALIAEIGIQLGNELDVPFYKAADWKAGKEDAEATGLAIMRRRHPLYRWWWWTLPIVVLGQVLLNSIRGVDLGSGIAVTLVVLTIASGWLEIARRRTQRAHENHVRAVIRTAALTRYDERITAWQAQQDELVRLEEERESLALARLERQRIRKRKRALQSGVTAERLDPPLPVEGYLSPRGAEELAAQWMRSLGEFRANVTQYSSDGGIDVESEKYVAQVKHYAGSVGVTAIRELAGVCAADGRRGLFFTSGKYTKSAIVFADSCQIALFRYEAQAGALIAANELGRKIVRIGL